MKSVRYQLLAFTYKHIHIGICNYLYVDIDQVLGPYSVLSLSVESSSTWVPKSMRIRQIQPPCRLQDSPGPQIAPSHPEQYLMASHSLIPPLCRSGVSTDKTPTFCLASDQRPVVECVQDTH